MFQLFVIPFTVMKVPFPLKYPENSKSCLVINNEILSYFYFYHVS